MLLFQAMAQVVETIAKYSSLRNPVLIIMEVIVGWYCLRNLNRKRYAYSNRQFWNENKLSFERKKYKRFHHNCSPGTSCVCYVTSRNYRNIFCSRHLYEENFNLIIKRPHYFHSTESWNAILHPKIHSKMMYTYLKCTLQRYRNLSFNRTADIHQFLFHCLNIRSILGKTLGNFVSKE